MTYILFATAFLLSSIAGYYAIVGLIAIFAAAPISIAIMGGALEVAKIVTVSWLHNNWKSTSLLLKSYFSVAVAILMLLTSMGIFGFLSKAHSEQTAVTGDVAAKVALLDEKIKISKENIDVNRKALKQLDEAVDQVMARSSSEQGADKAVQIRRGQSKERARLLQEIETEQKKIAALNEERAPIAAEVRKIEAEVGPIKYIAALIYGDELNTTLLESAVRWVIILIIMVFDPLAVLLFIAFNKSMQELKNKKAELESNKVISSEIHYTEPEEVSKSNDQIAKTLKNRSFIATKDSISMEKVNTSTGVTLKFDFEDSHKIS